jgi:hypothetical protein
MHTRDGMYAQVLAEYEVPEEDQASTAGVKKVIVAVREGKLMATAFHPELTDDTRWHQLFVDMCEANLSDEQKAVDTEVIAIPGRALDLPSYGQFHFNDPKASLGLL